MDNAATHRGHMTAKVVHAYVFGIILAAAGVSFLLSLVGALRTQSLSAGWTALRSSPYGMSALADYIVGSLFGAVFIYFREGPPVLGVSPKIIAILSPFIGSFLPLLYVSYMLFSFKDMQLTFVPKSAQPESEPIYDPPAIVQETKAIGLTFALLFIFFLGVCLWAFTAQSWNDGVGDFKREIWISVTFQDNLAGLLLTTVYVMVREGAIMTVVLPWIVAFALLGNAPTCVYVMMLAHESLRRDVSFATVLLSRNKART